MKTAYAKVSRIENAPNASQELFARKELFSAREHLIVLTEVNEAS